MSIKIRGKGKNKLKLEFEDEGFSLVNLLRQNLWDSSTEMQKAEYRKGHTYMDNIKLLVETEEGDPVEEVVSAAEKIKSAAEEIKEQVSSL
ncbi:MAG: RpoL/Rpb11 RNA polymerase subunit family protein [Candidatus Aenigmatarchaeota archaeon]